MLAPTRPGVAGGSWSPKGERPSPQSSSCTGSRSAAVRREGGAQRSQEERLAREPAKRALGSRSGPTSTSSGRVHPACRAGSELSPTAIEVTKIDRQRHLVDRVFEDRDIE